MPNKVYPSLNPQGTLAERIRCWQLGTDADLPGASTDLSTRPYCCLRMIGQTKCLMLSRANSFCLILQNVVSFCTDPDYSANKERI